MPTISSADLGVRIELGLQEVQVGTTFSYKISISNQGPSAAAHVLLFNTGGTGLSFDQAFSSQGSCAQTSDALNCVLDSIAPGAEAVVTVSAAVGNIGTVGITATTAGGSPDPELSNNEARAEITATKKAMADLTGALGAGCKVKRNFLNCSGTVTNAGGAPSNPGRIAFYLSKHAARGPGEKLIRKKSFGVLAPGASAVAKVKYRSGRKLFGKFLIAAADVGNATAESDEGNNAAVLHLRRTK
jgi:uncharacterized repeat protein (TIGR01451 family)